MGITIINHPFGNGLYQLSMVMTAGWFIITCPSFKLYLFRFDHRWMTAALLWPGYVLLMFTVKLQLGEWSKVECSVL